VQNKKEKQSSSASSSSTATATATILGSDGLVYQAIGEWVLASEELTVQPPKTFSVKIPEGASQLSLLLFSGFHTNMYVLFCVALSFLQLLSTTPTT
jgi:hypothetical protein